MAIDSSVYTVLQASRRSWRIDQTRPVKVYYFAFEDTIQEDALQLVAAKVSASLRVNGDTVGDGSLAELDELASGDLPATLAKIVTGETKIEARSLQQAFAEANAGIRQANALIGEYSMVAEDEPEPSIHGYGAGPQPQLLPAGNGPTANGTTRQPSLFPGKRPEPHVNGAIPATPAPARQDTPHPPAPRPRLLIGGPGKQ